MKFTLRDYPDEEANVAGYAKEQIIDIQIVEKSQFFEGYTGQDETRESLEISTVADFTPYGTIKVIFSGDVEFPKDAKEWSSTNSGARYFQFMLIPWESSPKLNQTRRLQISDYEGEVPNPDQMESKKLDWSIKEISPRLIEFDI